MRTLAALLLAALLMFATACTDSEPGAASGESVTPTSDASAGTVPTITVSAMRFDAPESVPPGARISIANTDRAAHTVTSRTPGVFDVHVDANKKATLVAPTEPGTYEFYCVYHPNMVATLTVA